MVNGVVYFTAGTRRAVVALDAATGEMLWMHSEHEGKRGEAAPRQLSGRGLSYWTDGRDERIIYVTPGYQMVALDAKTGNKVAGFGKNGIVDLKQDIDQPVDLETGDIGLHATPIIAKDVIVVGAAHLPGGSPRSKTHEKGYIRGFDARTGKRLWIFHTIPAPGEFGNDTWAERFLGVHRQRRRLGADDDRRGERPRVPAGRAADRRLLRRATGPETICSPKAWWRSISRPASASGTTSSSTTACGTWTFRARRSLRTSTSTDGGSRPSPSRRSRDGYMSSIA